MGNRHASKKLQRAVRERMALTGETYQAARARIVEGRGRGQAVPGTALGGVPAPGDVDLLPIRHAGVPGTLATFELAGRLALVFVSAAGGVGPFPRSPFAALAASGTLH